MKEREKPKGRADDEPDTFRRMRELAEKLARVPRSEIARNDGPRREEREPPQPEAAPG